MNPILNESPDSFGIVFNFSEGDVSFQKVCSDCLLTSKESTEGQTVKESVFTVDFHKKYNNIDASRPNNVAELFNESSGGLSLEAIRLVIN